MIQVLGIPHFNNKYFNRLMSGPQKKYKQNIIQTSSSQNKPPSYTTTNHNQRQLTINLLPSNLVSHKYLTNPFARLEAKLQKYKQLRSPVLISVLDVFVQDGEEVAKLHIINEGDEGVSLKEVVEQKGGLQSLTESKEVMLNVTSALVEIHRNKMIHDNVSLDAIRKHEGKYKLCFTNFKETNKFMQDDSWRHFKQEQLYFAPQKYKQRGYDQSSDIWSLGVLFLELLLNQSIMNITGGILPCELDYFPSENILERISHLQIKKLLLSIFEKDPTLRPKAQEVLQKIKSLDFESNVLDNEVLGSHLIFTIELFPISDDNNGQQLQENTLQAEEDTESFTYQRELFHCTFSLGSSQEERSLQISISFKNHPFTLNRIIKPSHSLNLKILGYFDHIEHFFLNIKTKLKHLSCNQEGQLLVGFDRQQCQVIKEMKEIQKVPFNLRTTKVEDFPKTVEEPKIEKKPINDDKLKIQVKYDEQYQTYGILESSNKNKVSTKLKMQYQDKQIDEESSSTQPSTPSSLKPKTSAQYLSTQLILQQVQNYQQFIQEAGTSYHFASKQQKMKYMYIILAINIIKNDREQYQEWLKVLQQDFSIFRKPIKIQAFELALCYSTRQQDWCRISDQLTTSVINIQDPVDTLYLANLYYRTFVTMVSTGLYQYYQFSYRILMKAAVYYKQHPQYPQCLTILQNIITNLKARINDPYTQISRSIIINLVPHFLPEYQEEIIGAKGKIVQPKCLCGKPNCMAGYTLKRFGY